MKSYMCTSRFMSFTVGKVYEMSRGALVDDDGDRRPQITDGSRIIRTYFKEVEAPLSLENK